MLTELRRLLDDGAKLFAYLDDWYLRVKPHVLPCALALVYASNRSINLELQPSKIQMWRASCPDPVPLEKEKNHTQAVLVGIFTSRETAGASPVVPGEHRTIVKTIRTFRDISATLAEFNAAGLHIQTVNDLLTMYCGAAS